VVLFGKPKWTLFAGVPTADDGPFNEILLAVISGAIAQCIGIEVSLQVLQAG